MSAKIFITVALVSGGCAIVVTLFVVASLFNVIGALYEDVMEELHDFKVIVFIIGMMLMSLSSFQLSFTSTKISTYVFNFHEIINLLDVQSLNLLLSH